jgi:hypothetical protein
MLMLMCFALGGKGTEYSTGRTRQETKRPTYRIAVLLLEVVILPPATDVQYYYHTRSTCLGEHTPLHVSEHHSGDQLPLQINDR